MTTYFLDSSALVKRYVIETGTNWIRTIVDPTAGHSIIIARLTPVEVVSGVMRRQREGGISIQTARAVRLLMDRHTYREYVSIELTAQVIQQAEDLIEKYPLRAYDSLQLASALESNLRLVENGLDTLVFVSSDTRLMASAASEGLLTEDPNTRQ